jgi:transposase
VELEQAYLDGEVECDEALFGGRAHGKRGWGAANKVCVFGIYKRNGHVLTFPVSDRHKETLLPLIEAHTAIGSLYYTDDYHAYASLNERGGHVVVEKEKGIPKGRDHVNGIEGYWSYAKHWLYPYRGVPSKYFHLYLKEAEWRFNHRNEDLVPLLRILLKRYL